MGEWDREDNPLSEHRNLFPHCPFMRGDDVGNVPVIEEDDSADSDMDPASGRAGRPLEEEVIHINYHSVTYTLSFVL